MEASKEIVYTSVSLRSKRFRRVWEQRTGFSVFCLRGKWGESQKKNGGGRGGEGRKEPLADKPLDFENSRSLANGARDWLG